MKVLMIRLGAMGDIVHAMPAALSLGSIGEVHWAVKRRWLPLIEDCAEWRPVPLDLRSPVESLSRLHTEQYDLAVDCQGLVQSALVARAARARRVFGYTDTRESLASTMYDTRVAPKGAHVAERHLHLARAAGAAQSGMRFSFPRGCPEGRLPEGRFVLTSPFAGWRAKQWPMERYVELARRLREETGLTLVANVAPGTAVEVPGMHVHESGLGGLIDATRRAAAVVGLDSGPMHLAAALGVPGVALFGPTDPHRNGPLGDSFTVLRHESAVTSYKRSDEWDPSLLRISVDLVMAALRERL